MTQLQHSMCGRKFWIICLAVGWLLGLTTAPPARANSTFQSSIGPDLHLEKSDGDVTVRPGDLLIYTITFVNNGLLTATGVQVEETIPAHTSYIPASNLDNWSCPANTAGNTCTLVIGNLDPNTPQTVQFVVQVDSAVPFTVSMLENKASIADDGLSGADLTDNNSASIQTPIDVLPVLELDKDDGGLVVIPGERITYTLTLTNRGAQAAPTVILTETVPAKTRFVGPAGVWSCVADDPAGTECHHTISPLAVDQPTTVPFIVQVLDPLLDEVAAIENSALVGGDGLPTMVKDTELTPLTTPPDLKLSKSPDVSNAEPGEIVVYTLEYVNEGGRSALNSRLTESIPANSTFNSSGSTPGWNCVLATRTCTLELGTIAANTKDSVTFAVQVDTPLASGVTQLENSATISHDGSQGVEPTPKDNTDSSTIPVIAAPDLTLSKTDGGITATAGETVLYELVYQNVGNQAATTVVLQETVPAHTTYNASESQPAWTCANGGAAGAQCSLVLGLVDGGATGKVRFAVTVDDLLPAVLLPLINMAQISDDGDNGADPTPLNNLVSDNTPLKAAPNLRLKLDDRGAQATPGAQITYVLTYTNAGDQAALAVVVTQTVPAHTVFVGSANQWSCPVEAPAGTICTYTAGALAGQSQGTVTFVAQVVAQLPANVSEVQAMAQIGNGGTPYADEARATTPITAAPELRLSKSDGGATVQPGQAVVYVLAYANQGNQMATGVVLTEQAPTHTAFVAALSTPGWLCTASNCTYTVGNLAAGASGQVEFAVQVDSLLGVVVTQVDNRARIDDDGQNGADPFPANNQASDSTAVALTLELQATLRVRLAVDADQNNTASPGDTLEYTAEIANRGNRALTGISFTDSLDPHTQMAGAGAVQTSQGAVQSGNNAQDRTIQVNVGNLPAGAKAIIAFRLLINKPLPADATLVEQQGTVTSNETPTISTDDPSVGGANDRTKTPVTLDPLLRITKLDFLFEDADGNELVSSGDKLLYSIKVVNVGNAATARVVLTDTPDANTTLVVGRVQSSRGAILRGNGSGDNEVQIEIGPLAVGESAEINLLVQLKPHLASGQLINQATATYTKADQLVSAVSDDPATAQAQDATVTPVNRVIEDVLLQLYLPLVRK